MSVVVEPSTIFIAWKVILPIKSSSAEPLTPVFLFNSNSGPTLTSVSVDSKMSWGKLSAVVMCNGAIGAVLPMPTNPPLNNAE